MPLSREHRLVDTFVTLTDTLVADYDVVEVQQMLVDQAVELFDAAGAAIHLANGSGDLEVIASTSDRSDFIALLQLDAGEGPCIEAFTTHELVTVESVAEMHRRWPRFAGATEESGYAGAHAIPLRLRHETIGSLNLFREMEGALNEEDARAAQALADVATISLLAQRSLERATVAAEQLSGALESRVVIEQAKGFVARAHDVSVERAFEMMRRYARSHSQKISDVAGAIARNELELDGA